MNNKLFDGFEGRKERLYKLIEKYKLNNCVTCGKQPCVLIDTNELEEFGDIVVGCFWCDNISIKDKIPKEAITKWNANNT